MTSYILNNKDDKSGPKIIESFVELEIVGDNGKIATVRRWVQRNDDYNINLVSVWNGPKLSEPNQSYVQKDYFTSDGGSAQREQGYHHFLAEFIGWDLPWVMGFDGKSKPLYVEAIFPMLFIEQKVGWSTIVGPFPTQLGIQDVGRRSFEPIYEQSQCY